MVSFDDGTRLSFERREDAIREAIRAAHLAGEQGKAAEVLSFDNDSELTPIWVYGRDGLV
jgi:hypothetical protein